MPKQTYRKSGFTFVEVMAVVAVIGILAAIAVSVMDFANKKASINRAEVQLEAIKAGLESYRAKNGEYPDPYGGTGALSDLTVGEHMCELAFAIGHILKTYDSASSQVDEGSGLGFLPPEFVGYALTWKLEQAIGDYVDKTFVSVRYHKDENHAHPFGVLKNTDWKGMFPDTDTTLMANNPGQGQVGTVPYQEYTLKGFVDPWDNPIFYNRRSAYSYSLFSLGPQDLPLVRKIDHGNITIVGDIDFDLVIGASSSEVAQVWRQIYDQDENYIYESQEPVYGTGLEVGNTLIDTGQYTWEINIRKN